MSKVYMSPKQLRGVITDVCGMPAGAYDPDNLDENSLIISCPDLPAKIHFIIQGTTSVILDSQRKPLNPLAGFESLQLFQELAMPELRPDAKFLAVRIHQDIPTRSFPVLSPITDNASPNGLRDSNDCLLVVQDTEDVAESRLAKSQWECIRPELSIKTKPRSINACYRQRWRLWRSSTSTKDVWLIPMGYFNAPKNSQGFFYDPCSSRKSDQEVGDAYLLFESRHAKVFNYCNELRQELELAQEEASHEAFTRVVKAQQKLNEACSDLNARLDELRQDDVFSDLLNFTVKGQRLVYGSEGKRENVKKYSIDGAETFLHNLELASQAYRTYLVRFEQLRERIEGIGGTLDTTSSSACATVKFPTAQDASENAKIYDKRSFPFGEVGLFRLFGWLTENESCFHDAAESLRKLENLC